VKGHKKNKIAKGQAKRKKQGNYVQPNQYTPQGTKNRHKTRNQKDAKNGKKIIQLKKGFLRSTSEPGEFGSSEKTNDPSLEEKRGTDGHKTKKDQGGEEKGKVKAKDRKKRRDGARAKKKAFCSGKKTPMA